MTSFAYHPAVCVGHRRHRRLERLRLLRLVAIGAEKPRSGERRAGGHSGVRARVVLHRLAVLLLLLLRFLDDLLQGRLDVVRRGVLDLVDEDLLKDGGGYVHRPRDLVHALDVLPRVGREYRVRALEDVEHAGIRLEVLERLLRLVGRDRLERYHHGNHPAVLCILGNVGDVHVERDAFLAGLAARNRADELLAVWLKVDAVHLEDDLDCLKVLLLGELLPLARFEGNRRVRDGGILQDRLADLLAVRLEDDVDGRGVPVERRGLLGIGV